MDNWLPATHLPKPGAKKEGQNLEMRVEDLRSMNREGWNNVLLKQLFSEEEEELVKRITVSSVGMRERLMWKHSKDGQYNVKSGYKLSTQRALLNPVKKRRKSTYSGK